MEKKNNSGMLVGILIGIIITLLVVGGLFATGTIGFKTSTTTDNGQTSENNQTDNSNITSSDDYDAESIAKEKMPVAISLVNQEHNAMTYCGGFEQDDMILVDTDVEYAKITMDASSKFKTLNELKNHLKENISEELINKYFKTKENSYLEKDGKLYCQSAHKGFEWIFVRNEDRINEDNPIEYTVLNKKQDSFDVKIEVKYGLMGSDERDQLITIDATITKTNSNWLVTKYEQK